MFEMDVVEKQEINLIAYDENVKVMTADNTQSITRNWAFQNHLILKQQCLPTTTAYRK